MTILQILILTLLTATLIWLLIMTVLFLRLRRFFQRMTLGIQKKDMRTLLETIDSKLNFQQEAIQKIDERIKKNEEAEKRHLQHAALIRYNPFDDTGGNQSFVLSLLDALGRGFVVTSLHNRERTRIYAKEVREGVVEGGKSEALSKEEREAISTALKKK